MCPIFSNRGVLALTREFRILLRWPTLAFIPEPVAEPLDPDNEDVFCEDASLMILPFGVGVPLNSNSGEATERDAEEGANVSRSIAAWRRFAPRTDATDGAGGRLDGGLDGETDTVLWSVALEL